MGVITDTHGAIDNPPLVYSLIMLRFPEQANLEENISVIQESLKQNYPIYEKRIKQGIELTQSADGQSINVKNTPEFLFFDADRARGVLVKEDRIIFHTSVYPSFDKFSSWFKDVAEPIIDTLSIKYYLSCGVRYVDAMVPNYESGETLNDYLNPAILDYGVKADNISAADMGSIQVNNYKTGNGTVIFKSFVINENGPIMPPDLRDLSSQLRFKNSEAVGPFAVLDFDHGYTASEGTADTLELSALISKIDEMHVVASNAFLNAINIKAIERWQK